MTTVVVADLHLGTDMTLLVDPGARSRLLRTLEGADRVVLLGDALDLRHAPLRVVLDRARSVLAEIAAKVRRVVLVPGNHDHRLAAPILEPLRRSGEPLELEQLADSDWLDGLRIAYPGIWLRPDVYATHGHYLDCHLTVPRPEVVFAAATQRLVGRIPRRATPTDYEAALSPVYALAYELAQGAPGPTRAPAHPSWLWRTVKLAGWRQFEAEGPRRRRDELVTSAGVAVLNRLGLGPFRADFSSQELSRAAVAAMGEVVSRLRIEAEHVIAGHTHLPGEWTLAGGTRLVNAGSWSRSPTPSARQGASDPFRPETCVVVRDEGPPELR
jgi:predicted phosphodiesterase